MKTLKAIFHNHFMGIAVLGITSLFIIGIALGTVHSSNQRGKVPSTDAESETGLKFRLSESPAQPPASAQTPAPKTEWLSESETRQIFGRLPKFELEPEDVKSFKVPEKSLPPPRTGKTVQTAFPSPAEIALPEVKPGSKLEVLRFGPEGNVELAPNLSVTFNQPMVPVTAIEDLKNQPVPVRLSPEPPGKWRWLGTKTLVFEPTGRFPMATDYKVSVPAGTKSALGMTLAAETSWKFSTPPPTVKSTSPSGQAEPLMPLLFVAFDQKINPEAVLKTIRVTAEGKPVSIKLATPEQIQADAVVASYAKYTEAGYWLAFQPVEPLPKNAGITVIVQAGTPSAEGPRTTPADQSFNFRTYGPLVLTASRCGWDESRCRPSDQWNLSFSNSLDIRDFRKEQITITPALKDADISVSGSEITISGAKPGSTTYTVTVDRSLKDTYGQVLGKPVTVTFKVGTDDPSFFVSGNTLTTLEPAGAKQLPVYTTNVPELRVRMFQVTPADWHAFLAFRRDWYQRQQKERITPPGKLISTQRIPVRGKADELTETRIDLTPALSNGLGHVIVLVKPLGIKSTEYTFDAEPRWVQSTRLAVDALVDNTDLVAWANSLADGKPVENAEVVLFPENLTAKTGTDGLARLALKSEPAQKSNFLLVRKGIDTAILPETDGWWQENGDWHRNATTDGLRWFVFDDRKLYKPGETINVKGWIRRLGTAKDGDIGPATGIGETVTYAFFDSQGNEFAKGTTTINAYGGFSMTGDIPKAVNMGYSRLELSVTASPTNGPTDTSTTHTFQIEEFRRPEYEVTVTATDGPHLIKGFAETTVNASYYSGGGLGNAETNWRVSAKGGSYSPPNWDEFTFGTWQPWWRDFSSRFQPEQVETFTAKTDFAGQHRLRIDFDSATPPRPYVITAEASVQDVNRQTISGATSFIVHPSALYVGVRVNRTFINPGEVFAVDTIVTDIDGKVQTGRQVMLQAVRMDWVFEGSAWKQKEIEVQKTTLTSTERPMSWSFSPGEGGSYKLTARVMDDLERFNQSELTLWVSGGKQPPSNSLEQQTVDLIPNQKTYQPGETAEILVQAPFVPAEGLMTVERTGILYTERFTMTGPSTTLKVPIKESYLPNIHVQVDLTGAAERMGTDGKVDPKLPKRPAYAKGTLNLKIPPMTRKLSVKPVPRENALQPGSETAVEVEIHDAVGKPVPNSECALVVVDESVLALTGYKMQDPLELFYQDREEGVQPFYFRPQVVLKSANQLDDSQPLDGRDRLELSTGLIGGGKAKNGRAMAKPVPASKGRLPEFALKIPRSEGVLPASPPPPPNPEPSTQPIELRTNFSALAVFSPSVVTDANGKATVKFKLPDNLTRYRVMAVAVAGGKQFGLGEAAITARLPLMIRPSAPRFLNYGDTFELPVVVQNQTDQPMEASVVVRANHVKFTQGEGQRVTVPANDRVEIRFPAATSTAGEARFQIGGVAGNASDAAEISLPVYTPATTEAFATYGEIDAGSMVQPVTAPGNVISEFGGLQITTSSTQLQALTDAVVYLSNYPFECSEQISSRILAIAALRDVLTAFNAPDLPKPEVLNAKVQADLKRLETLQHDDGGFSFWRNDDESWPYISIHVAHALARAREKDYPVPEEMLNKSKNYLKSIESRMKKEYSPEVRWSLMAYALNVRHRLGDSDTARAKRLIAEAKVENLPMEALGWLLPVLSKSAETKPELNAVLRFLSNRVTETAGAAHYVTSYRDGAYVLLHSERRTDGIILEGLIAAQPESDLIPKLVRGLLANRTKGRWMNTQENAFILLALDRYFSTYEKATPDFIARAWLGQIYAGEYQFKGRTTDRQQIDIPMSFVTEGAPTKNLILSKDGTGRMYYRIGMNYAPKDLVLKPYDAGFTVMREYEAVDKADDVKRLSATEWEIKAGARVRVKVTMVAPTRRYHVALVDPLPAGLEILNPALATTGSLPPEQSNTVPSWSWRWARTWFEHQNLRDDRAEAFTSLLWDGVYSYVYYAQATTPGRFIVPPTKAEEMYAPETFGRGRTDVVTVR